MDVLRASGDDTSPAAMVRAIPSHFSLPYHDPQFLQPLRLGPSDHLSLIPARAIHSFGPSHLRPTRPPRQHIRLAQAEPLPNTYTTPNTVCNGHRHVCRCPAEHTRAAQGRLRRQDAHTRDGRRRRRGANCSWQGAGLPSSDAQDGAGRWIDGRARCRVQAHRGGQARGDRLRVQGAHEVMERL